MVSQRQLTFWLVLALIFFGLLWLLNDILLPFLVGLALAYLLDPLCDRLERLGLSRPWATLVICLMLLVVMVVALILLVPLLVQQSAGLISRAPQMLESLQDWARRVLFFLERSVSEDVMQSAREALNSASEELVSMSGGFLTGLISGGVALFNLLALLVITPVVTFFLLRDWDRMVDVVDGWLPRQHEPTIRTLARETGDILEGFIRGQGLVCLFLAVFYAIGLSLAGLDFGLVIGLIAGVLSFIPYVGSFIGLVLSLGVALVQFDDLWRVAIIAAVFLGGQFIEGNFLTPKVVGDRVRLHPVWVIFGLLAGGALFGFVGVLLAVPATAVIGVVVRFMLSRYKDSIYYRGPENQG